MRSLALTLGLLAGMTLPAATQLPPAKPAKAPSDPTTYRREVFVYRGVGRRDPFASLLTSPELGLRPEDLTLVSVLSSPDPRLSVAIFVQQGSNRRVRLRVGERLGNIRVTAIRPREVQVVVEEFGVARPYVYRLRTTTTRTGEAP